MVQMVSVQSQQPPDPPPQHMSGLDSPAASGEASMPNIPGTSDVQYPPGSSQPEMMDSGSIVPNPSIQVKDVFMQSNPLYPADPATFTTIVDLEMPNYDAYSSMSHLPSHSSTSPEHATTYELIHEDNSFLPQTQTPSETAINNNSLSFHPTNDNNPFYEGLDNGVSWNFDNTLECYDNDKSRSQNLMSGGQSITHDNDESKRERRDSSSSTGTTCSASSGETFTSAYTDTVSSVNSTDFLLKQEESSEDEATVKETEPVQEIYFNSGYLSSSSSERLNSAKESDEDESSGEQEMDKSGESLLGNCEETEQRQGESGQEDGSEDKTEKDRAALDEYIPHSLIPITEHEELTSFLVEEVEPTMYTKITNNITVVDESFLFESQNSLNGSDTPKHGGMAATMQNLHERLSFIDLTEISRVGKACQKALIYLKDDVTFGSLASLNNMASKGFDKDPGQGISLIDGSKVLDIVPSTRHTRNLVALSVCVTLMFIALGSVRNLQSSINHEGGVGVISMAVAYLGYMVGSIFSASIVQNFQPRKCIIICLVPQLLYVAANIYPAMWLMAPISFIQGVALSILWNAMSTYVTFLARGRAQKKNESFEVVSSRFFGIFCLIYQSYLIVGNLIASLVLMYGNSAVASIQNATAINNSLITSFASNLSDTQTYGEGVTQSYSLEVESAPVLPQAISNLTLKDITHIRLCGAEFCPHFDMGGSAFSVSDETKYLLFGTYMCCIVLAIVIAVCLLEPLNVRLFSSKVSPLQKTKEQLVSLVKFSVDKRFLLVLPMLMYSVIQFGFVSAEVTTAFITCPLGIHMVGYTMICLGVCGSISSYLSGLLSKYTGRISLFLTAATLNLGVLIFMTQWQLTLDSLIPYFVIMGIWGVSDGIWISQVNSLMGVVFPDKYEEAFAGLRVSQGLGVAISFGYSSSLCMAYKIYIVGAVCIVSVLGYLAMEYLLRRDKSKQKPVLLKQTSV